MPLGELLVSQGLLSTVDLERALAHRAERGIKLGQALVDLQLVSQADLELALRAQGKVNCIRLTPGIIDREVAAELGEEKSRKLQAIAINRIAGVVTVALEDPLEIYAVDALGMHLKCPVLGVHAEPGVIKACIEHVFKKEDVVGQSLDQFVNDQGQFGEQVSLGVADAEEESAENADLDQPVIHMVRAVLEEAFTAGASDIHLEPRANGLQVRFRVDGSLYERVLLPKAWVRPVLARLKITASLDISERRLPQDGRAQAEIRGKRVDLRVATTPTLHGEGAVVRILDGGRKVVNLAGLDIEPTALERLHQMVIGGDGIVLATGPTGSGKTTTLYALLQEVNSPDTKIITVEDPVENQMDGATQICVNAKVGLTFARGLRSILRQDPDVVLLGEIRDEETAEIAVQAALTGHLVLSTLHTVGTAESVTRLTDMGLKCYLLADTLRGIVAQRLVRRLCPHCRREVKADPETLKRLGLAPDAGPFFEGAGCEACSKAGFKGRVALYEIMKLDSELCEHVRKETGSDALRAAACKQGMRTLRDDGIYKALNGLTTLAEVLYVTARS